MKESNKRRKIFIEEVKNYEKRKQSLSEYVKNEFLDADGYAAIDVDLTSVELFNPLSMGKQMTVNTQIIDYIDERVYAVPVDVPVKIVMHGSISKEDKENLLSALHEHYDLNLNDKKLDLRINTIKSVALFVIGFVLLAAYFLLANFMGEGVWYEILSIVATFVMWEAADFFILERHTLRVAYYEAAQLALIKIEFES